MLFITSFDPTVTVPVAQGNGGTFNTNAVGTNRILISNDSVVTLVFYFPNGYTAVVHAGDRRLFCMTLPHGTVTWIQQTMLNALFPPNSTVYVEAFEPTEHIPETYPAPLVRTTNTGNSVPLTASATSILNTGNVAGTSIVQAMVTGDASNAVTFTNDAQVTLGDATHAASFAVTGQIKPQPVPILLNGATSGTAELWQMFTGTYKEIMVILTNFQNGGVGAQTIVLPQAFSSGYRFETASVNTFQLIKANVAQTVRIITSLAVGGGSVSTATSIGSDSMGDGSSGFDTISFSGGAGSAHSGVIFIKGR